MTPRTRPFATTRQRWADSELCMPADQSAFLLQKDVQAFEATHRFLNRVGISLDGLHVEGVAGKVPAEPGEVSIGGDVEDREQPCGNLLLGFRVGMAVDPLLTRLAHRARSVGVLDPVA